MEKRVAVYNNNTGVIETMSSLLAGEGLKMVAVTGRAQLQELLRAQEIQLLLLDVELDGRGWGEGIEMIHDIRNMTTIPIIIITLIGFIPNTPVSKIVTTNIAIGMKLK